MNNIFSPNIIDCTLRDGGYYNNWKFSKKLIQEYLVSFSKTEIKNIEIGFLTIPPDLKKGITANCDHNFFKKFKIPGNINIGIMINATDLLNNKLNYEEKVNILKKIPKSKVKFIRIACHIKDLFRIKKYFKFLKKLGFKMFLNIMQISEILESDIRKVGKEYNKLVDVIYFADSFGSLNTKQLNIIINKFKKNTNSNLGIHAHDNMGHALKNTIFSYKNKVEWLDSTLLGMGRGPGNTKTEDLIDLFFGSQNSSRNQINKLILKFKLLQKIYKWGTNKFYWMAGKYKIHPTYIQMLLSDNRYSKFNLRKIIINLKKYETSKYNPNTLFLAMNFFKNKKFNITNKQNEIKFKKKVIIFGNGETLKNKNLFRKKIFSDSTKILINRSKFVSENDVDLISYCHPFRLMTDLDQIKKSKKTILMPYKSIPYFLRKEFKKNKIINFNLELGSEIKLSKQGVILAEPLNLLYCICYLISKGYKKIYLAGFDGYEDDDPFNDKTQLFINKIKKFFLNVKILSLTKTRLITP
tara:strand:- start:24843 stop:26417 length:1575 start_codon:yes stop_codon:yes gene_type:complete